MKISEQPTSHILVRADCTGDWEICNFAIVNIDREWAQRIRKRIEAVRSLDDGYASSNYYDHCVSFHVDGEGDGETEPILPEDRDWAYVELEEGERDSLRPTESRLECYMLKLYGHGTGRYQAYGKHSGDTFFTRYLPLGEIIGAML